MKNLWSRMLGVFSTLALLTSTAAAGAPTCARTVNAHVVALDQPLTVDRMGATMPGGMIFALAGDVFPKGASSQAASQSCLAQPGTCTAGNVVLRDDKRPRPVVLRVNEGDCLAVSFTNLLNPTPACFDSSTGAVVSPCPSKPDLGQPTTRFASVHVQGMPWQEGPQDDGSFVGKNPSSLVAPGGTARYLLYAEHEGSYLLYSTGDSWSKTSNGDGGQLTEGLFGAVNVQPAGTYRGQRWGAQWYRSQVTEQDLCLATPSKDPDPSKNHDFANGVCTRKDPNAPPKIDYNAVYPAGHPRAGLPVLDMLCSKAVIKAGGTCAENELIHSDLTAIVTGPSDASGQPQAFPDGPANTLPPSLRPIYAYADRRQPYREFTIVYHESFQVAQAFAAEFTSDRAPSLNAAADNFGINYGMAGLSAPVLANRLGVGPQGKCTDCKFEEFFLSSWALGDPALVVNNPPTNCVANGQPTCISTLARFPDDPSNVYHSYMGDHLRFRILHAGADLHHLHHQHAHQWLATPNSPNGDYLDSQSIGPGSSFTLEMVYYGSGNVNQAVGDSIFHCHFYPHFASGMWSLWRVHDVFEGGTILKEGMPADRMDPAGRVVEYTRALPDGEITKGTPIPGLVPMATLPMAPMPAAVRLQGVCKNDPTRACFAPTPGKDDCPGSTCVDLGTHFCVMENAGTPQETCISALQPAKPFQPDNELPWNWQKIQAEVSKLRSPGFPFFIPGIGGSRAPHPPLDFAWACSKSGKICTPLETISEKVQAKSPEQIKDSLGPALQKLRTPNARAGRQKQPAAAPATEALQTAESEVEAYRLLSPLALEGECGVSEGVCEPLDGGLPRSVTALGSKDDWIAPNPVANNTDFSKVIDKATAVALPETGTLLERVAMATHAVRLHDTQLPDGRTTGICSDNKAPCTITDLTGCGSVKATCDLKGRINFVLNGRYPQPGAPYADPCIRFDRLGERPKDLLTRAYLAVDLQLDSVFNKEGWHFPQQRMLSLWGDAFDFLDRKKPPQPLFMRANSNDCMSYTLANLVPNVYELDDFEVRTPTDILGQHIHLVKFDVTSSDGAGNGWNYEDGTFAPNEVTERINAINNPKNPGGPGLYVPQPGGPPQRAVLTAKPIKFFGPGPNNAWVGAQATVQRWYDDPLYNNFGVCADDLSRKCSLSDAAKVCHGVCDVSAGLCSDNGEICTSSDLSRCQTSLAQCNPSQDRTIRTVFTHDHFGPSTHQQAGLYAGVVAEPKDSAWLDNETGKPFGGFDGVENRNIPGRHAFQNGVRVYDGGPTSWQAIIKVPSDASKGNPSFREFLLEVQDSTLLYQPFTIGGNPFEGSHPGICGMHPDEPCGFCSYNGVCVSTTTGQPVPSAASPTSCLVAAIGAPPSTDCPAGSSCLLHLGNLTPCTPQDLAQHPDSCKSSSTSIASCNFVTGVPSTSWAAGTPINSGKGLGNGGIEAITFNNATNNFSFNYRNEPLFGRTTDPATGYPLPGRFGDMAFAYSSLGFCVANPATSCIQDTDCGGSDHCSTRPSPRPMACSASLNTPCSTSTVPPKTCPSGAGTCQPTGFCSDNYALCTAGSPGNVSLCSSPAASCLADAVSSPYPPLTQGVQVGDPFTPLLRTYAGDDLHIRTLIGAHINPHNFTLHGMNWLKETSYVDSGWRNSMVMGISEHFESVVRVPPPFNLPPGQMANQPWADFMYQPGLAAIEQASGNWGLLRAYDSFQRDLFPLPQNTPPPAGTFPPVAACPATAPQRSYRVVALYALQALGGPLVYNQQLGLSDQQAILYFSADDPQLKCMGDWSTCRYQGVPEPLVLRAAAGDCIHVTLYNGLSEPACSIGGTCPASSLGRACGQNNVGTCGLYPNGQGTCVTNPQMACTPSNFDGICPPDLCLQGQCSISKIPCNPAQGQVCKVGCQAPISGSGVPSQQIAYQQSVTSLQVGLRPQLVTYDPRFDDGTNGGFNTVQTAAPGGQRSYTWYAGNINPLASEAERYIPIEFGAANLLPADPLNHYLKGLFAGLIIEPAGSTWTPKVGTRAEITYKPRTGAGPAKTKKFKEFVVFMQDDSNNLRTAIANDQFPFNAVNYKSETLQNASPPRFCPTCPPTGGVACMFTQSPSGKDNVGTCIPVSFNVETPIFTANAGDEVRFRLLHGGGTNTNNVFELYGHNFSDAPYMTLAKNCVPAPITQTRLTASQFIGEENLCGTADFFYPGSLARNYQNYSPNTPKSPWKLSLNEWKGSIMGHGPGNHEDVVITSAGGPMKRCGDYLYRSYPADHGGQGIWGIFRVEGCPAGSAAAGSSPSTVPAGQ